MPQPLPYRVVDAHVVLVDDAIAERDRAIADLSSAFTEHLMHLSTNDDNDIDDQVRADDLRTKLYEAERTFVEAYNRLQTVMML